MELFREEVLFDIVKGLIPDFSDNKKNDDLIEMGLTSIQIMDTANNLKKYGVKIPVFELGTRPVFNEWIKLAEKYGVDTKPKVQEVAEASAKTEEFPLT